jgi:heme/copper-type cytochrome/quinol oxidase subunit 2
MGSYTLIFTAKDNAGNTATQTIKYTVLQWTIKGFYQPVDMNGVENTVKGGSTGAMKFEVFKGTSELTATSAIVTPLKATRVTCDTAAPIDEIEALATGGTVLRYDATAGQFIYTWQTPKQPGACYDVTVAKEDGSSIVAEFKLR